MNEPRAEALSTAPWPDLPRNAVGSRLPWRRWLTVHLLVWAFAAWLSRGNLDVSGDMAENYVWGIEWQAGYAKHPPLFAWVTAAWFSLMPRADWAYFALSVVNVGVGLLGVAALARRFLSADAAVFAAVALAVSPLYTGLALKFNANAVQLSVWPWAVWAYVVFMQRGSLRHAAACGALVALALLGKYFSVVLALALVLAALAVPAWRLRLRGVGPWLALGAAALVLAPHLAWLVDQQFMPLRYAEKRSASELGPVLLRLLNYSLAQVGYLLPGALLLIYAVRPGQRREAAQAVVRSMFLVAQQRELWWLAFAPMLVVAGLALSLRMPMAAVWGMAQWFAVTTLWLGVLHGKGMAPRVAWLRRAVPVYWALVTAIALALGYAEARQGSEGAITPRLELARATHALWHERTGATLKIVAGSGADVMSVAFYSPDRTRWWSPASPVLTPWITLTDWRRDGGVLVCAADDSACAATAQALVASPPMELSVRRQAWGILMPNFKYRVYLQLPA